MKTLSDVCEVYSGYALKEFNDSGFGVPVIKIGNITADGSMTLDDCQFSSELVNDKYYSKQGDIYVALSGATTGKIGILETDEKYIINQRVGIVRRKDDSIPQNYLKYFLLRQTDRILEEAAGCAQPNISPKQIALYRIPEINETQMLEESTVLDKLSDAISLRKSELQRLDELIKARFVELFGDPGFNPKGFVKISVGEAVNRKIIAKPLDGNHGEKHPKASEYVEEGVPFVMANNLVDGLVDYSNCAKLKKERTDALDKGFAHDGDVLITHKGTIGRTAIVHTPLEYIMLTPQVTYYRPIEGIMAEYLKGYFDSEYFQKEMAKMAAAGGSTRAYIGITNQTQLPVVIPPIDLQIKYADYVKQVDKSKVAVKKALEESRMLFDSLMQEYFG